MTYSLYLQLPKHPFDPGVNMSLVAYVTMLLLHMVLHKQLLQQMNPSNCLHTQRWSWLLIASQTMLPLWRGVHQDMLFLHLVLVGYCAQAGIRMALVVSRNIQRYANKQSEQSVASQQPLDLRKLTFHGYLAAVYLDDEYNPPPIRITDPIQQKVVALLDGYKAWLARTGWLTLPSWLRYVIRLFTYYCLLQLPLLVVKSNHDFLAHYAHDAEDAARAAQLTRLQAFGCWTLLIFAYTMILYGVMNFWSYAVATPLRLMTGTANEQSLFRYPWLAASPRDFWSRRWNLSAHSALSEMIYIPACQYLDGIATRYYSHHQSKTVPMPILRFNRSVAVFTVFLCSGILHDYMLIAAMGYRKLYHLRFFCSQALLLIGYSGYERFVCRFVSPGWLARILVSFPVGWIFTVWGMGMTAHWFYQPLMVEPIIDMMYHYTIV